MVDVDGGQWVHGAHARPAGIRRDREKRDLARALGWTVLVLTPEELLLNRGAGPLIPEATRVRIRAALDTLQGGG